MRMRFPNHGVARFLPAVFCVAGLVLTGCAVGPNYKRPSADIPATYRGTPDVDAAKASSASLGEQNWWDVFQDPQLQQLIRAALQQNYDVRIAAARVLQAQAQVGITRADRFPTVNGLGSGTNLHNPATGPIPSYG